MLAGKSALVTGSSQGIGLGIAQAFAASGAKVVVTSEKPVAKCPEVQRLLSDYEHTRYVEADLLADGDVLVVAGKGHEQTQVVGDVVHPFDDVAEVRAALELVHG